MKRALSLFTLMLLLVGCGMQPRGSSDLTVLLTDAPASEASSLNVTFGRIELVPSGESDHGIIIVSEEVGTIDVLQLRNGGIETLGKLSIPDGVYTQMRVIVESAEIAFGDEVYSVKVPSGAQTGLKINIEPALVAMAGEASQIILDFDAERAVIATPPGSHNYLLKPTGIRAVTASGIVEGMVVDEDTTMPVEGASVYVYTDYASDAQPVTSTITEEDGGFKFITLVEGTYDLVVIADGYDEAIVLDVNVIAGENTNLEPIGLVAP